MSKIDNEQGTVNLACNADDSGGPAGYFSNLEGFSNIITMLFQKVHTLMVG